MKTYDNPKTRNNKIRENMKAKGFIQTFVFIPSNRKDVIQTVAKHCRTNKWLTVMIAIPFMKRSRTFGILGIRLVLMPGIR
jgi:hypothetical protein